MIKSSTLFLRIVIIVIGLIIGAICVFALPLLWVSVDKNFSTISYALYAVLSALYLATIPFYTGLVQAFRLLGHIDKGRAFSRHSVRALSVISSCAGIITGIFILSMPFFYIWAEQDDAPGLVIIAMVLIMAPMTVSVFAAVMKRLFAQAVELKSENDLTV